MFFSGVFAVGLAFVMFVNVVTWSFYDGFVFMGIGVLVMLWVFGWFRDKFLGKFK